MPNIVLTMAEDPSATTADNFGLYYRVDEHDCLHFAQCLKELGHQVYFVNWNDFQDESFKRIFSYNKSEFVQPIAHSDFRFAFVYKMEGFYFDMPRFHHMVSVLEKQCGVVVNHPSTIRHNICKDYLFDLLARGLNVIPSYNIDESTRQRLRRGEKLAVKLRHGERGNDIFLADRESDLEQIAGREHEYFAQEFIPEIREGERSLVFLGFEFCHAVLKRPSASRPDEFRCNESLGGTVEVYEPTEAELALSLRILKAYEQMGYPVHFSRIDLLNSKYGSVLLEAELLNPSIYANYSNKGRQFGEAIANYFQKLLLVKERR